MALPAPAAILKEMRGSVFSLSRGSNLPWCGLLLLCVSLGGCKHSADAFNRTGNPAEWRASKEAARQELNEIPPPSKNLYLEIHEEPQWQNPFLSVERDMIQVRLYLGDNNTSPFDRGGITRTTAARRQVLNVRLADLPRALAALPSDAWPYGRVVAVQEGLADKQDRAQIRRNLEITMNALNDLGIVVDDWNNTGALR